MRVLVVSQYFWPENFRINEIAKGLKSKGIQLEILTGKPNYPDGSFYPGYHAWGVMKEKYYGMQINRIPILERGTKSSIGLFLNYFSFIVSACLIAPWIMRRKKFDLIFVYAPSPVFQVIPALFLGWVKKIPVVLWVQDLWPESASATGYVKSKKLLTIIGSAVKFCYKHTDIILVQSKAFIPSVKKFTPDKKVIYFPNSVDSIFYSPESLSAKTINSLTTGFSILFAGNVGHAQSVETIVNAAALLSDYPEIRIVIVGSGSMLDWVKCKKDEKELTNLFVEGRFSNEEMPSIMRSASALLVSLRADPIFSLTIPNKIQAYMAVGKPIIASLNGEGARIIHESGSGLVAPAENESQLAEQILKLYRMSAAEREAMGSNGRKYFKNNFDEAKLIDHLIAHFESALNAKGVKA